MNREKRGLSGSLLALMAVGSGLSVASNYYVQPLLALFTREFEISPPKAGLIVTLSQLGYIAGLVFLVPLGDRLERRRLLTLTTALTAVGLGLMSLATGFAILAAFAVLVGITSVTAQIIVPLAAHLAAPERRARTVSTVMSGLLIGILLARTFAGTVAEFAGWRAVYGAAAVAMAGFSFLCFRLLPPVPPTVGSGYGALLASVFRLFRDEPVLRRRGLIGSLTYGSFGVFWTTMAFMLAERYHYGEATIGLFGLIGAAGAICAQFAGRIADKGWARLSTGGFVALMIVGWGLLYAGQWSIAAFVVGVVALDLGAQGTHISNQSEVYRLDPKARSRLTTGYMTCNFTGGAIGSGLAATLYVLQGWSGVCLLGAAAPLAALGFWALTEFRWPVRRMRHITEGPAPAPG